MKAEIKFKPFDPASGSDTLTASATATNARGAVIATGEISAKLSSVHAMGVHAKSRLQEWERQLRALVEQIAEDSP